MAAKGLQKHQARLDQIGRLGKALARRSGRACEWCGEREELLAYDTDTETEPTEETLALLCARCRRLAAGERQDPRTIRFLEGAIWHEVPAVKFAAAAVLRTLTEEWAADAVEAFDAMAGYGEED